MNPIIKKTLAMIIAVLLTLGTVTLTAGAATNDEAEPGVIYVTREEVESRGFRSAVQYALNEAADKATDEMPYTVVAPAGSYDLSSVLRVFSNTTLDLRGVTLKRMKNAGNMLRVGSEDGLNTGAVGYQYKNIRLIGGVFDGNYEFYTMIKAFHTKGFTMEDVTLLHEKEGHMMEYAGVDGLTIRGCTFKDQYLTKGNDGYEVIQLDVLHDFHIANGRCEDLPITNVLIENCSFDNVPRAIGSHTAIHNWPHNNIVIRNNRFTNIGSIAIQGMGWTNVDIRSNYIENSARGITVLSEPYGCTYLSSKLAKKGDTASHVSDAYQKPAKSNINIAYNTLKNIGYIDDIYASYSSQGIAVLGEKLTSRSPIDSTDESGGLPAGDYYIDTADIHDNYIDIRGNGIRVEDTRNVRVAFNEIICSKNTVHKDNYYGIVLRNNANASAVSYNTIANPEVNGIQLDGSDGGSVDTIQYNRISGCGKYGIGAYSMKITNIYDNDIISTKNIGLFLCDNTGAAEVRWNRIRNCSEEGIWITANSAASLLESNTTVNCAGSNYYGGSTVKSNYTSSKALTDFHIPWYFKPARKGAQMGVGTMFKIVPDVRPTNAFASFSYSSSNTMVATVDGNGMVKAVGEGTATIKVTSDNGISKSYPVAVEGDRDVTHIESSPLSPVLILGDADGNGFVETTDVTFIQRHLAYIATPYSIYTLSHGDVDGNGLDIYDATCIRRYLVDLSTPYKIGKTI